MKKILLLVLSLILFVLNLNAQTEGIYWEKDFNKAKKFARESGRPLLLDFTAPWCKPCLMMDKEFWVREDVIQAVKPFIAVKINYDDEKDLASRYGANAIPFVVFTDPLGSMVTFRRGFGSKNVRELAQIFEEMPKDFSALLPFYTAIEKNKNDGAALLQLADSYRAAKMTRLSCDFYKRAVKTSEIQNDAEKKERVLATIGVNYYSIRDYENAVDYLEDYVKTFPQGKTRETVLLALILTNVRRDKLKDADKYMTVLKTDFPNSTKIEAAAKEIETAKNKK